MPIPKRETIKSDLMILLQKNGSISPSKAYLDLAIKWKLTEREKAESDGKEMRYHHRIRTVKQILVDEGFVEEVKVAGHGKWNYIIPNDGSLTEDVWQDLVLDFASKTYFDPVTTKKPEPIPKIRTRMVEEIYRRPEVAAKAIFDAGYKCEVRPDVESFNRKVTDFPYVEAHHLVPISAQKKFEYSLDVSQNVVCLCPFIHRLLHHGTDSKRDSILRQLYDRRKSGLLEKKIDPGIDGLIALYSSK